MRTLSAGWRMKYISGGTAKGCIFCSGAQAKADLANMIVVRGGRSFVMMNRYPYTTGHLMVAPYRHVGKLSDLKPDEACEIMDLVRLCEALLREALHADGLNVGINIGRCAGAGYPGHVHVHVVPRWNGDTNFMPVVSETRVLPETLTDTYRKITRVLRRAARNSPDQAWTGRTSGKVGAARRAGRRARAPVSARQGRGRR